MSQQLKTTALATASLIGTIIGVGIFGVPYAISKIGAPLAAVYFVALGGVQLLQHLFYAEAAMACPDKLRLVGLSQRYLGLTASRLAGISLILGAWASLLAYIIVGGVFLHLLLAPWLGGTVFAYQAVWAAVGFVLVYFGLDLIAKIDFWATVALIAALLAIAFLGWPHVRTANFSWITPTDWILPYGVILYSLGGLPTVLEMEDILKGDHRRYRLAITLGTLAAIALTSLFGFVVYGITGGATPENAIDSLRGVLGGGGVRLVAVFGFLAVATSFFATGTNLRGTWRHDYRLGRLAAWLATLSLPIVALLAGIKSFVAIISFSGAVFGGVTAIIVVWLYVAVTRRRLMAARPLGVPISVAYGVIALLAIGAVYETVAAAQRLLN
ncbi:hypothetical protein A3C96_00285 [Candidatus Uhrbacteria bacterium RIFCSPHIGHO2_02_FULL_60_10]|uniref:Amino acid transporter transmembrane domain-containing protein n=1 Tax=Candidatus Uhrbacteria bacterium RIFCSPHIGHO2_02_FULL_60_10 TaxID=1802392 RepID=A0A1F7U8R4_9BACT|nr:MAG: hypothetical protein A3C96_00285 [Candidatus Uhrbacteria bacterium RIFCSPHIGHO2_02_FULL_60_10]